MVNHQLRRRHIAHEFDALLAVRSQQREPEADHDLAAWWQALPEGGDPAALTAIGFQDARDVDGALRDFARSPSVRDLSDAARARLDRLMPVLLQASAPADRPLEAIRRLLALLHNVLRRSSYLALLDEQPMYGAQLRAEFEARTGGTWPLNIGQVYTTLSRLERDGLVSRTVHAVVPPRVDYALTDLGRTLLPPVVALVEWAFAHTDAIREHREAYDAAG